MMEPSRLRATIASARQGSPAALEALLEAYGPRLYAYFCRATGNHHDAEDLLSEMALRLVRTIGKYDDRGRFEPWLFRIAANMVRDRIRRAKVSTAVVSLSLESESGRTLSEQLAEEDSPEVDAGLLASETSIELKQALDRLDPQTRDVILLRHFGDLSFREIAQMYQCPLGTVLARVHRGLKTLRRLMGVENGRE